MQERAAAPSSVILSSGDVVKLSFSGAPELNQAQKIRADGKINLPLVGEVDAAVGALEVEPVGDLPARLVQGVLDLLHIDL